MISLPSGTRIWLIAGVTDMRKSFNGLGEQIQHVLDENPFSGHLFSFFFLSFNCICLLLFLFVPWRAI